MKLIRTKRIKSYKPPVLHHHCIAARSAKLLGSPIGSTQPSVHPHTSMACSERTKCQMPVSTHAWDAEGNSGGVFHDDLTIWFLSFVSVLTTSFVNHNQNHPKFEYVWPWPLHPLHVSWDSNAWMSTPSIAFSRCLMASCLILSAHFISKCFWITGMPQNHWFRHQN